MGNKPSVLRSSSRAEEANATPRVAASGPSAALAEPPQQGEPSGSVAKLLTGNIASVRPVEQVPRGPTALDQKCVFQELHINASYLRLSRVALTCCVSCEGSRAR